MYKYVFCDVDATLFDDDKNISDKNYEAINKCNENGSRFFICTGRVPYCIDGYVGSLSSANAVTTNGQILKADNKILYYTKLDDEVSLKVLNFARERNLTVRAFGDECLYVINDDKNGIYFKIQKEASFDEVESIIREKGLVKIVLVLNKEEHYHAEDLKKLNLNAEILFSSDTLLEINHAGDSKGCGIKKICELTDVNIEDTIGIGDNHNDISMLETVGLPCCPANAVDEVKRICKYISPYTNNESAVADIIEKFVSHN